MLAVTPHPPNLAYAQKKEVGDAFSHFLQRFGFLKETPPQSSLLTHMLTVLLSG